MWLVRLFAVRLVKPTTAWLAALMSALLGGIALGFLGHFSNNVVWPHEYWGYSIGLALGLFIFRDAAKQEMDRWDQF
jgi:hypothetical protein